LILLKRWLSSVSFFFHCRFCLFRVRHNGLCMCSAGLKARNFQLRTEPIRLFIISNFPSNRQRRIGGVATTSRSPKKPLKPALHIHFVSISLFLFKFYFISQWLN
jgi:hypothetical protein